MGFSMCQVRRVDRRTTTLTEDQMLLGVDGSITITKGVASRLKDFVDSITKSIDGTLDRRISAYQKQVEQQEHQ